jgi:hypothetical protein
MSETNPRESDLILGGQNPPPVDAAILGGLAGVKQRLESESIAERLQALNHAVAYGDDGIDLALRSLTDPVRKIKQLARRLLKYRLGEKGKLALLNREPFQYFNTFDDWQQEIYNTEIGITDFENNAYVVTLNEFDPNLRMNSESYDISPLESLIKDSHVRDLQSLIIQIHYTNGYYSNEIYEAYERKLISALQKNNGIQFNSPDLKALFYGDTGKHKYRKTKVKIFGLHRILEMYPKLEILQIRGNVQTEALPILGVYHESLQTLIVETACANIFFIESLFYANLPALEYLELWGMKNYTREQYYNIICLLEKSFPNLKYLGLISGEGIDELIDLLVESPIIDRILILNLSMGSLTDRGARILINCPAIDRLHTLDVSHNCITRDLVRKLSKLSCNVKLQPQRQKYGIYGSQNRYNALYE